MTRFRVEVQIMPRQGILDPQGKAVADALHALGFGGVREARVGKHIGLDDDASDAGAARDAARDMCSRLLANPVTEDFAVTVGATAADKEGALR